MTSQMDNNTVIPYNSYQERVVLASVVLFISVFGSIGNTMVIAAVLLSKTLRTRTNIFVVNLSIADLFACLAMPWWSVAFLSKEHWLLPGTEWLCQVAGMVVYISIGCSMWNLTFIAINRFILITKPPSTYRNVYCPFTILIMLFTSWVIPVTLISVPTLVGFGKLGFEPYTHTCSDIIKTAQAEMYDIYQSVVTAVLLITITICYAFIFVHVRRHFKRTKHLHEGPTSIEQHEMSSYPSTSMSADHDSPGNQSPPVVGKRRVEHHQDMKKRKDIVDITKNLFIVVCVVLACLMPIVVVNSIDALQNLQVYAVVISLTNSSLNPVIYAWRHPHFKIVLRLMLRCQVKEIPRPSSFLRKFL